VLYRLPEVIEAIALEKTIFIVEGEKDADRLWKLQVPATCNAGGAGKWRDEYSEYLSDASVVILPDNDTPGREHARQVAESLGLLATSVRVLELPDLGNHGDVSNWLDAGGTVEALHEMTARAPTCCAAEQAETTYRFRPVPFDRIKWSQSAEYLINGIIPRIGLALIYGPPKSGKSFWAFDTAVHIAMGCEYRGRRVRQGAVVYVAAEGGKGFEKRIEAFRRTCGGDGAPFYLITARPNLIRDHKELIEAIRRGLGADMPVAVYIDTVNRSLVGSESKDTDVAQYISACGAVEDAFSCAVVLVHHSGLEGGRPRGHTSLTGSSDVQISVARDAAQNIVTTVEFEKDGPADAVILSRLEVVEIGLDGDGNLSSSCVIRAVEGEPIEIKRGAKLKPRDELAKRILANLLCDRGKLGGSAPDGLRAIERETWRDECFYAGFESEAKPEARRKAFQRMTEKLAVLNVLGEGGGFVWLADGLAQ